MVVVVCVLCTRSSNVGTALLRNNNIKNIKNATTIRKLIVIDVIGRNRNFFLNGFPPRDVARNNRNKTNYSYNNKLYICIYVYNIYTAVTRDLYAAIFVVVERDS